MDTVPKDVGSQVKTVSVDGKKVEMQAEATTPTTVKVPQPTETPHAKSKATAAATADVPKTFFQEGLTHVDKHAHGATAFYFEGSLVALAVQKAITRTSLPFRQEGLVRVNNHAYGATAFYK